MRAAAMASVVGAMLGCGGCATLVRGEYQTVHFRTEPSGAQVQIDGRTVRTPAKVKLQRKGEYRVTVSKEGYRTVSFPMKAQWDGLSLGNLLIPGGSIGFVADTVKGSDRAFHQVAVIRLPEDKGDAGPLELDNYRGRLVTREEYERLYEADRDPERSFYFK